MNKKLDRGFAVRFKFRSNLAEKEFDDVTDDFVEDAIEKRGLMFGGGGNLSEYSGFITSGSGNQTLTNKNKEQIIKWIESRKEIIDYQLGRLVDANK